MLKKYMLFLCKLFKVTPSSLRAGRRGNLPPAQGADDPERYS